MCSDAPSHLSSGVETALLTNFIEHRRSEAGEDEEPRCRRAPIVALAMRRPNQRVDEESPMPPFQMATGFSVCRNATAAEQPRQR